MSKRIFRSAAHQELFDRQGFIVLPFVNTAEVAQLNSLFDTLHPDIGQSGFFSGSYSADFEYKKKASDEIVKVFSRAYEDLFTDYTPFGGAFLYKVPGANSALAAHQDWTIVDEQEHVALNCWVPLQDITADNGPIMILPGSQYDNFNVVRAPTLPFFFSGNEDVIHPELIPMIVPAGTAVILNQSVIHYSPDNKSAEVRRAITAGVKSAGARMKFHYRIPGRDALEVFDMEDDFLISFRDFARDIGQRPYLGTYQGEIPYTMPQPDRERLREMISDMKTRAGYSMSQPPRSMMQRVRSWLSRA